MLTLANPLQIDTSKAQQLKFYTSLYSSLELTFPNLLPYQFMQSALLVKPFINVRWLLIFIQACFNNFTSTQ